MTTTGPPEGDRSVLLVLVLLGAETRSKYQGQHMNSKLLYARGDAELLTLGKGTEVSVTEITAQTDSGQGTI
jgi:hypothetical protein